MLAGLGRGSGLDGGVGRGRGGELGDLGAVLDLVLGLGLGGRCLELGVELGQHGAREDALDEFLAGAGADPLGAHQVVLGEGGLGVGGGDAVGVATQQQGHAGDLEDVHLAVGQGYGLAVDLGGQGVAALDAHELGLLDLVEHGLELVLGAVHARDAAGPQAGAVGGGVGALGPGDVGVRGLGEQGVLGLVAGVGRVGETAHEDEPRVHREGLEADLEGRAAGAAVATAVGVGLGAEGAGVAMGHEHPPSRI